MSASNVAHYTRHLINQLANNGRCHEYIGNDPRGESRARSRIYNAARRAGLKVRTHREGDSMIGTEVK